MRLRRAALPLLTAMPLLTGLLLALAPGLLGSTCTVIEVGEEYPDETLGEESAERAMEEDQEMDVIRDSEL